MSVNYHRHLDEHVTFVFHIALILRPVVFSCPALLQPSCYVTYPPEIEPVEPVVQLILAIG